MCVSVFRVRVSIMGLVCRGGKCNFIPQWHDIAQVVFPSLLFFPRIEKQASLPECEDEGGLNLTPFLIQHRPVESLLELTALLN